MWCFVSLAAAPLAAGAFVWSQERRGSTGRTPLLPLGLLGVPAARRGLLVALAAFVANGGFFLTTAVTLQDGRGLTPLARPRRSFRSPSPSSPSRSARAARPPARRRAARSSPAASSVGRGLLAQAVVALGAFDRLGPLQLALPMAVTGVGAGLVMVRLVGVVLSGVPRTSRARRAASS